MTDVLICGINGKMGRATYEAACEHPSFNVTCGVDRHTFGNFDCPVYTSLPEVSGHFDAIIDFSSPSSLDGLLSAAEEYDCAVLICTTGHSAEQLRRIREAESRLPVRLMPNTSAGILALEQILPTLAGLLHGFDACICETHRRDKHDSPSGTALRLKELLCGMPVQVCSFRAGDIPGEHQITLHSGGEMLKITHTVLSRRALADGALRAVSHLLDGQISKKAP